MLSELVLVQSGYYRLTRPKCASIDYSQRPVHDLHLGFRCRVESFYKRPACLWVCFLWHQSSVCAIYLLLPRSRDAVVNYWAVPNGPNNDPTVPIQPTLTLSDLTLDEQADLTALNWNHDGSLVAIGSYDSILRICEANGETYFKDSHHKV